MPLPLEPVVTRSMMRALVEDFYTRARVHPELGPIFEERLAGHWEKHFDILTDFWLTVLGGIPAYKGNPFGKHMEVVHDGVHRMSAEHFDVWLDLFAVSTAATLPPEIAVQANEKARRIADSLRQGLFFRATVSI